MTIEVNNLNLKDTITCGQIFRFIEEDDNSYTVVLPDRVINLKMNGNQLIVDSNNMDDLENVIRKYLDLDYDYNTLNKMLIEIDKNYKDIIEYCNGLKMINEPRFEVVISYILSANNGVPQIRNGLNNISKMFGKKVIFRGKEYYLFPTSKELEDATVYDLRECKTGFRDKYIYEFIQKINDNKFDLDIIETMNTNEALDYLMTNKGIGEKVASCILLFGYHRFDVFPIDSWVKKYMKEKHNLNSVKEIREYMWNKYEKYSGLIIQYVFDYSRNKKD